MNVKMKHLLLLSLLILLVSGCGTDRHMLLSVSASPEDGFNYPYFLSIPPDCDTSETVYLMVEPNNTGFVSDDLSEHIEKARNTATNPYYLGRYFSEVLHLPLLVPAFPRPETGWNIYTHSLDRDVMLQKDTDLERIDLQLLAMVRHASDTLRQMGITIRPRVFLTGFSASGTYVNRFTLLHPERVAAAAAGGVNGLLMLPDSARKGIRLAYPLGIADYDSLTGRQFDSQAFRKTPQFYFMGALDDNDAIPYADGYSDSERRDVYGAIAEKMMPDRWDSCIAAYREYGVNATFQTFEEIGHAHPDEVKDTLVQFFKLHNHNHP